MRRQRLLKIEDFHSFILENKYYPRTSMTTASYIGDGLDYTEVYSIIRDGFSTIIMHISQELGRYGRTRSKINNRVSENFDLIINIESFLYINEISHVKEN